MSVAERYLFGRCEPVPGFVTAGSCEIGLDGTIRGGTRGLVCALDERIPFKVEFLRFVLAL